MEIQVKYLWLLPESYMFILWYVFFLFLSLFWFSHSVLCPKQCALLLTLNDWQFSFRDSIFSVLKYMYLILCVDSGFLLKFYVFLSLAHFPLLSQNTNHNCFKIFKWKIPKLFLFFNFQFLIYLFFIFVCTSYFELCVHY